MGPGQATQQGFLYAKAFAVTPKAENAICLVQLTFSNTVHALGGIGWYVKPFG
jgi:hypothetical protein